MNKIQINYPIGTKVIIIGNEPNKEDPNKLLIGEVVGYENINDKYFIKWKAPNVDKVYMTFSEPLVYSKELENSLNKLTWDERWNIYSRGWSIISKETAKKKEYNHEKKKR